MSIKAGPAVAFRSRFEHEPDQAQLRPLAELLRESFSRHGNLPAIEGRNSAYTFEELDNQSATVGAALVALGVRAGDIVPLLMHRSPEMIVAQIAILRLGAAYAPIDRSSPPARRQSMLEQIKPSIVLYDGTLGSLDLPGCLILHVQDVMVPVRNASCDWVSLPDDALAYVMFTSGTTGVPKGVMVPQSGITRLVSDADFANMQIGSRWAVLSSPAFDASTLEIWAPLLNGGCCVVQETPAPSIDELAGFLLANAITDAWLTSALFNALVDDRLDSLGNLSQLLTGGERVSPQHVRTALHAYPNLRLINGYGPTENTTFTACHAITLADTNNSRGIPIGRPIRGTDVRIGADRVEPVEGELYAGGLGVALGYLNDPQLTALKFVEIDGRRWYRTGDIVRRGSQRRLEFVGRADRQVKLQGHRVELDEVERELNACSGVSAAVVRLRGMSAESRHLVAYYTCAEGSRPTPGSMRQQLNQKLTPAAIPTVWHELKALPRNSSGKVDLQMLDGLSDSNGEAVPEFSAAANETENRLLQLWQIILPASAVHKDASFEAFGGNSIRALQLSALVRRHFGRDLSPLDILRTPLLSDQARLIESAAPFEYEAPSDKDTGVHLPLTSAQRAMLASSELDDSHSAFLVHVALHLPERPNTTVIKAAFEALAGRHSALRLRIENGDEPTHATVSAGLPDEWWKEHAELDSPPRWENWSESVLDTINRPLDLFRAGVMRVDCWPVADGSSLLVWTIHHVSMDESSIDHSLHELNALLSGAVLPPVYGSPMGFAAFEKGAIDREAAREWPTALIGELHGQLPPLPRTPARGSEFTVPVSEELSANVLAACTSWRITPFTPLLLAFGEALQNVFGSAFRFVSTPFSRRAEAELMEPVGCLLDLRIVDAGRRDGESQSEALLRVNDVVQRLQQPSFFPNRSVAEIIARRDAQVAEHLNNFGFTWRLNPTRPVPFGPQRAELLRVPQMGARFGITLHAWLESGQLHCSIEAVSAAVADGRAVAVGKAFVRQLEQLSRETLPFSLTHAASAHVEAPSARFNKRVAARLRDTWSEWLNIPVESVTPDSHFLNHGGNSLTAMRLAAHLRREHGMSVNVGAFLSHPTFETLCTLAAQPAAHVPSCAVMLGPVTAPRVVVVIPGNFGTALGSYRLADELLRRMGESYAVAIVDLETMLLRAPQEQTAAFLNDRIEQLVNELGWERIVAVAGISSGGLFALNLVAKTHANSLTRIPVWLIDTYAPLGVVHGAVHRVGRPLARRLLQVPLIAKLCNTYVRTPSKLDNVHSSMMTRIRESVHRQLFHAWNWPRIPVVHLLQATKTVKEVVLLWRGASNGFKTRRFARWSVHPLDCSHSELSREFAPAAAEIMANNLKGMERP